MLPVKASEDSRHGRPRHHHCHGAPNIGTIQGVSWGADDTIIFGSNSSGLFRVPAGGGTPTQVTIPDAKKAEQAHRDPEVLPDGRAVLFTIFPSDNQAESAQIGCSISGTVSKKSSYKAAAVLTTSQLGISSMALPGRCVPSVSIRTDSKRAAIRPLCWKASSQTKRRRKL
jgi:hypothetical protein